MAEKNRTQLKADTDTTIQPGISGGILANDDNTLRNDVLDSVITFKDDSPSDTFSEELTFDDQRSKFISHQLAGNLSFTLAASGNLVGSAIVLTLLPDSSSTIAFSNDFRDINDNDYNDFDNTKINKVYMYYDSDGKAYVNIKPYFIDLSPPTIVNGVFASDNSYFDVTFSDGVYSDPGGTLPIALSDLLVIFLQNTGTATDWVPSTVTKTDGNPLTGGEAVVRINGSVAGVADGNETLEVRPATGASIYDVSGNAMDSAETTGAVNLFSETSIIIMEDDFAGTVIDTNKWTVVDPPDTISISQDDELIFDTQGTSTSWGNNYVETVDNIPETQFAFAFDSVSAIGTLKDRGLFVDSAAGNTFIMIRGRTDGNTVNFWFRDSDGTDIINNVDQAIAFEGKTWRVSIKGGLLKISYWGGASWTDVYDIVTNGKIDNDLVAQLRCGDATSVGTGDWIVDNAYLCDDEYATQYPT